VPLLAASGMPLPTGMGSGLLVQGVLAGGPAERAGVLAGDLLIGLEGVTQGVGKSISEQIEGLSPDAICHLSLLRDGRLLKVDVRPEWRN
jgi:S1-C subfamily serine protease